MKKFILQEI
jgi:exportin-1